MVMVELRKNEIFFKKEKFNKREYTFSLRNKEEDKNDFMLVITERLLGEDGSFKPNRIKIYNEGVDGFFNILMELKEKVDETRQKEN